MGLRACGRVGCSLTFFFMTATSCCNSLAGCMIGIAAKMGGATSRNSLADCDPFILEFFFPVDGPLPFPFPCSPRPSEFVLLICWGADWDGKAAGPTPLSALAKTTTLPCSSTAGLPLLGEEVVFVVVACNNPVKNVESYSSVSGLGSE